MAEEHRRPPVPSPDAPDQGGIVPGQAVSVQLDEVGRQALDVIERIGPVRMARQLDDVPDAHEYSSRRCTSSAPPDAEPSTYGTPEDTACSIPRASRSPATIDSVPPTKPKSNAASQIGLPLSVHIPVRTDSLRPSDSSSSTTSS